MTRSLTSRIAWHSFSASSRGVRSTWNARRCALLPPMPGSRLNCSISSCSDAGRAIRRLHSRQLEAAEQAAHLVLHCRVHLAVRVVERGDDQVLQHADFILGHHLGIDGDLLEMLVAVDDHRDHAAAGGGLNRQLRHFALEAFLHLLRLLHHVLYAHRYLSYLSSIVVFSTGNISSTAWTVELAMASAFTSGDDVCPVAVRR